VKPSPCRPIVFALAACGASAAGADPLDEIVVTARRLSEPLAAVPLSLQVLSSAEIARSSVRGLYSLAARAPGLSFESTWGGANALPTLRGQFSPALGDTVGVFVDGVYQASRSALDVELLDIERVEVAYGPQSTLYGHSTFAGAIGYIGRDPTESLTGETTLEAGTGDYLYVQGNISGPVGAGWLGRLAASERSSGGTQPNAAAPGSRLGGFDREAIVATLANRPDDVGGWDAALRIRYEDSSFEHPAAAFVAGEDYGCGSQDPASGLWSYWCGPLPTRATYAISPGLPDSVTTVAQAVLQLGFDLGTLRLESDTSYYDADSSLVRDFDASSQGTRYGVCSSGANCSGTPGVPRPVDRLVTANQVASDVHAVQQATQEFRLRDQQGLFKWMVGAVAFLTRERVTAYFGTARGDLGANQRLTAVLPATPLFVGPLSVANLSLVEDPAREQKVRQDVRQEQTSYALFGTLDYEVNELLTLRAELRATRERLQLDSRRVNFQPSFGRVIRPQDFDDVTARLSASFHPSSAWHTYASAARGSRAGGINPLPGLPESEQVYEPEFNWTYELGARYRSAGLLRTLDATAYYIDWSDAQINGLPSRPGLSNLIVVNTAGLTTRGLELSAGFVPFESLRAEFSYSYADPRFRAGSDDYGSSAFCGLSATVQVSSFCTVGPPRRPTPNSPALVPWLDGNAPGRAPQVTWHGALTAESPWMVAGWQPWARLDLNHQDDVFERQINGARFGERTLLDARIGVGRGRWSLEAWGLNLTDEHYIRASFSRQPIFYPTQPRPLDLIYAEGRRYGVTLRASL
jgi:iron complex outermembrane receptor protein